MHILVDQDDVLAAWWTGFTSRLQEKYYYLRFPFIPDPLHWDLTLGLTQRHIRAIDYIKTQAGFFASLEPIPGAREALNEMIADGHTVTICTTPEPRNPTCASDKLAWLEMHIGPGWAERAVLTLDKTLVRGDILIDDRPDIVGAYTPTWEHILFTSSHNKGIVDHRRRITTWEEWRNVVQL